MSRALIFDLYGTLVHIARPVFQREVSRLEPAARRAWVSFERDTLVVTPYASHEEFVRVILERFHPGSGPGRHAEACALLDDELASVAPYAGVRTLLQFCKRRGLRLGLLSNAATPYREPLERLGLAELFDTVVYSCDERLRKPDARLFATVCERLGVAPADAVMVGDSLINDVRAAAEAGLQGVLVGRSRDRRDVPPQGASRVVESVAELAWCRFDGVGEAWLEPLLRPGTRLSLGGGDSGDSGGAAVERVESIAEPEQGRYNVVVRAAVHRPGGGEAAEAPAETVYVKRFLHPVSVHVEALVHELLPEMGVVACAIEVLPGSEPLLVSAAAPGEKLSEGSGSGAEVDAELAWEIGRHFACGFLLANADLRPRNAFLTRGAGAGSAGGPRLVMIDHEYCLLDRALDLDGVADPFDRRAIEALGEAEIARRVVRQVLTPQTMRRARRQFFDLPPGSAGSELAAAFRGGWAAVHRLAQANAEAIRHKIADRLERSPALVAGTLAYRRALTRFDLDDLMRRIALDPDAASAPCVSSPRAAAGAVAP